MSTPFSELYQLVRAVIGDNDVDFQSYSDDVIEQHFTLLSLEHSEWPLDSIDQFADLTSLEKARVVLHAAHALIGPAPNNFSYRTPILSVARTGGINGTLLDIERRLANLEASRMVKFDTDVYALLGIGSPPRMDYGYSTW